MGNVEGKREKVEDISLDELMKLTRNFLQLADEMYKKGKLNEAEYRELTFLKQNFLAQAERSKVL